MSQVPSLRLASIRDLCRRDDLTPTRERGKKEMSPRGAAKEIVFYTT